MNLQQLASVNGLNHLNLQKRACVWATSASLNTKTSVSNTQQTPNSPLTKGFRPSFAAASGSSLRCPPDTGPGVQESNTFKSNAFGTAWILVVRFCCQSVSIINPNHVKKELFQANLGLPSFSCPFSDKCCFVHISLISSRSCFQAARACSIACTQYGSCCTKDMFQKDPKASSTSCRNFC